MYVLAIRRVVPAVHVPNMIRDAVEVVGPAVVRRLAEAVRPELQVRGRVMHRRVELGAERSEDAN